MEVLRFRGINYKGKREYIFDPNGTYIRINGRFVKENVHNNEEKSLKKKINKLLSENTKIKAKVKGIKNLHKKLYYIEVWIATEKNDLTKLKYHDKRAFRGYHLDHIFPISEGYKRNIPVAVISDINNLRFVHFRVNLKKRNMVTEEAEGIIEKLLSK